MIADSACGVCAIIPDYPREKLDIKIVIEEDDTDTANALASCRLAIPFEVIVAPPGGPRTKPKALNAALQFARGTYTVVFDAEDRPEADQLRKALAAFDADPQMVCVQARLSIDNAADSWLSRMFTAEYAGQFDVLLPGMSVWLAQCWRLSQDKRLGSGLIDHSQKMTVAAMQMADMKV